MNEIIEKPDYAAIDEIHKIPGVDLCEDLQRPYLDKMINICKSIPKWKTYGDAVGLFCMLNIIKPQKLIEVGSGWSSAMTLDVNEYYLNRSIELTFIEPYPEVLTSLLKPTDKINLKKRKLQEIELAFLIHWSKEMFYL